MMNIVTSSCLPFTSSCPTFYQAFASLPDPRLCPTRGCYRFLDLLFMSVSATIGGFRDCDGFALFAYEKRDWFSAFCKLPRNPKKDTWRTPSSDTFERLFRVLNPQGFAHRFSRWTQQLSSAYGLPHVALDGKTLRGSGSLEDGLRALHLVSAWSTQGKLCLGQVAVDSKSNEIKALPILLQMLSIHGALVTIDAMGCQKDIAKQIIEQGGDYVLMVKGNQEKLYQQIRKTFAVVEALDFEVKPEAKLDSFQTEEKGHGREEIRTCFTMEFIDFIEKKDEWSGIKVIGKIIRERVVNGVESIQEHYFIGSRLMSAEDYADVMRDHWGIENNLHWQLDVSFGEDDCQMSHPNARENFAVLRRHTLNLLTQDPSDLSIVKKQQKALLNDDFRLKILQTGSSG